MNIHEKITKYREKSGFNKSQFAREIGVSPAYVTMLENGTKSPSTELIIRMAYLFNINPKELDSNIELNQYDELNETFKILLNSPEWEDKKDLIEAIKDRLFKNFKEKGTYRTQLFNFYEALSDLKDTSIYYDNIDKKIVAVGLDNFKKVLPEEDLSILTELIFFAKDFKRYLNGCNKKDNDEILVAKRRINIDINEFNFLNIPSDKELKITVELVNKEEE
ncbi:helix-turn-helix domain-containing protein [Clostridium perfringens]|uniref:helix-turn-helix domain-containing protein n=1 Tax=Clostridium perfringens TaxID=1502 RepID=UPI001ABBB209|nr:helix-turn-helix domain-containing protein [Clostridium perfringens]MBO3342152.1 helix-turn-helix transcriptional regulator [Clostridium perfringens]